MKQYFFAPLFALLAFLLACNAQTPSSGQPDTAKPPAAAMTCEQVDGRQYNITLTTGGKAEGSEVLSFKNKTVESSECIQYGFMATPFSCTAAADGSLAFEAVMTSEKEGRMDWKGSVSEGMVRGTVLWAKTGQADIAYTFEGPAK